MIFTAVRFREKKMLGKQVKILSSKQIYWIYLPRISERFLMMFFSSSRLTTNRKLFQMEHHRVYRQIENDYSITIRHST